MHPSDIQQTSKSYLAQTQYNTTPQHTVLDTPHIGLEALWLRGLRLRTLLAGRLYDPTLNQDPT